MHVEKDAAGSIFTTMEKCVEIISEVVKSQYLFNFQINQIIYCKAKSTCNQLRNQLFLNRSQ